MIVYDIMIHYFLLPRVCTFALAFQKRDYSKPRSRRAEAKKGAVCLLTDTPRRPKPLKLIYDKRGNNGYC